MGALCHQGRPRTLEESKSVTDYREQQEKFEQLLHSNFSGSKLYCPSGSQIIETCINKTCPFSAFKCQNKLCKSCQYPHQSCKTQKLQTIQKEFQTRLNRHESFLRMIFEEQRKLFNLIQDNRNSMIKQFKKQEYQSITFDYIKKLFLVKEHTEIQGAVVGQLFNDLKKINSQSEKPSQELERTYKKQVKKVMNEFIQIQKKTIADFTGSQKFSLIYPNPHKEKFDYNYIQNRAKVTLNFQDFHWYNLILDKKVDSKGETSCEIRQTKTKQKNILIGVGTSAIFGQTDAYKSSQSVVFITGDGFICQGGKDREGGRAVQQGQTITISVNPAKQKVTWSVRNEVLATAELPKLMRKKELYLTIMMYNKDDQLEIFI